jgi:hypothetical protein
MILKKSTFSILVMALLVTGCKNAEQLKENKQLSLKIESVLNKKDFDVLDLTKISDKDWDSVCIIPPYATNDYVEKQIGFIWKGLDDTERGNDGISLLLFIKNKAVVEYVQHPRNKGDFLGVSTSCIPRKNAKLVKLESNDNWIHLAEKH